MTDESARMNNEPTREKAFSANGFITQAEWGFRVSCNISFAVDVTANGNSLANNLGSCAGFVQ